MGKDDSSTGAAPDGATAMDVDAEPKKEEKKDIKLEEAELVLYDIVC